MKRRILALLLTVLLIPGLLSACNRQKDHERIVEENDFYYNRHARQLIIDYWYDTSDFVYDPLTEEELKTLFPVDGPEWMQLTGEAVYSAEGELLWVELVTPLEQNIDYFHITLGDHVAHDAVFPYYADFKRSVCGETSYVVMDESANERVIYSAMGLMQNEPIDIHMADDKDAVDIEKLQKNFEQLMIYFSSCPEGSLDLSALTPPEEPEWFEFQYTREKAYADPELGMYMPETDPSLVGSGEYDRIRRWDHNEIAAYWKYGEGLINWHIRRLGDSYADAFLNPEYNTIYAIEELTAEVIREEFGKNGSAEDQCLDICVKYEEVVISIYSRGIDANTIYSLLTSVPTK